MQSMWYNQAGLTRPVVPDLQPTVNHLERQLKIARTCSKEQPQHFRLIPTQARPILARD